MSVRGRSKRETRVRFPPVLSGFRQSSQRTSATRCTPQAPHRIEATASRTRASSPCLTTRAATGTSPEWPQPHRIRRLPPRRRPSRRPSRRSAMSSRAAAPACPVPAGRPSRDFSRAGFAACFTDRRDGRNLPDAILRDERMGLERPENAVMLFPSPKPRPAFVPAITERWQPKTPFHHSETQPTSRTHAHFPYSPRLAWNGVGTWNALSRIRKAPCRDAADRCGGAPQIVSVRSARSRRMLTEEVSRHALRHPDRQFPHRDPIQVGASCGGLHIRVTWKAAGHRQALPKRPRGVRLAHVLDAGTGVHNFPRCLQVPAVSPVPRQARTERRRCSI